tara:strand:+ start:16275 stop:17408 length:1134 start_codon:yes stop_codon:yes gene_type:complete
MTQFLSLDSDDATNTKTLLYESIPLTGTVVSGTYSDENIKNYTHGMFQSVYDYPYLSSSANHIFDISMGYHSDSVLSSSTAVQNSKKINIYNQMSLVLLGASASGEIQPFETDLTQDRSGQALNGFFINLSRLITKDQIKKGTFSMVLGTGSAGFIFGDAGWKNPFSASGSSQTVTIQDISASDTGGTANTYGGDYGVLYNTTLASASAVSSPAPVNYSNAVGLIFYQAGIIFLSSSALTGANGTNALCAPTGFRYNRPNNRFQTISQTFTGSAISGACDSLRRRIKSISFNNTTEINSTIYFCRVPHNRCNMSSNPTYLTASQIRVKSVASDPPVAYITTVGLYNSSQELLAIAKLSEPLRKDPTNEITLRLRLDY